MPEAWRKPLNWNPLGALTLKSDSDEELIVEVSGQDEGREMKRSTISLPPKKKVALTESFYSITSLHVRRIPEARIGIHCAAIRDAHIISTSQWNNIWVYGMEIFLAGQITYEEFGRQAKTLLPNSKVYQYERTRVKNLALPVSNLKPIEKLIANVSR